jgi:hypothetical protein
MKTKDQENIQCMLDGWDLLFSQAKIIAMLPLEDWLEAFDRAEILGPILDPTLFYRDYIYDKEKGESIKAVIRAAIPLKQKILELQEKYAGHNGHKQ